MVQWFFKAGFEQGVLLILHASGEKRHFTLASSNDTHNVI